MLKTIALSGISLVYSILHGAPEQDQIAAMLVLEAVSDGQAGMVAVASVLQNRAVQRRTSLAYELNRSHQFTGYSGADPVGRAHEICSEREWYAARIVAEMMMRNDLLDTTNGATHFHHVSVNPSWAKRLTLTARIGSHLFYR